MGCADVSFVIASARDHFLGWAQDKARPGRQTHSIDLETMFPRSDLDRYFWLFTLGRRCLIRRRRRLDSDGASFTSLRQRARRKARRSVWASLLRCRAAACTRRSAPFCLLAHFGERAPRSTSKYDGKGRTAVKLSLMRRESKNASES